MIDRFNEDFESELSNTSSREETFERAKSKFESVCGFTPYRNYGSFRRAKYQARNRFR